MKICIVINSLTYETEKAPFMGGVFSLSDILPQKWVYAII